MNYSTSLPSSKEKIPSKQKRNIHHVNPVRLALWIALTNKVNRTVLGVLDYVAPLQVRKCSSPHFTPWFNHCTQSNNYSDIRGGAQYNISSILPGLE